MLINHDNVSLT